jgi:hypothetical protein
MGRQELLRMAVLCIAALLLYDRELPLLLLATASYSCGYDTRGIHSLSWSGVSALCLQVSEHTPSTAWQEIQPASPWGDLRALPAEKLQGILAACGAGLQHVQQARQGHTGAAL